MYSFKQNEIKMIMFFFYLILDVPRCDSDEHKSKPTDHYISQCSLLGKERIKAVSQIYGEFIKINEKNSMYFAKSLGLDSKTWVTI